MEKTSRVRQMDYLWVPRRLAPAEFYRYLSGLLDEQINEEIADFVAAEVYLAD